MNRTSLRILCFAIAALLATGPGARLAAQQFRDIGEAPRTMQRLPVVENSPGSVWQFEPRYAFAESHGSTTEATSPGHPPVEVVPQGDLQAFDHPQVDPLLPPPDYTYSLDDPTLGPTIRIFEPKARVYFDTGWEAPDKLDIFHDGSLAPSINFLEIFWAHQWPEDLGRPDWRWGPNIGVGISSRAGDSTDGTTLASGAPVLLMSYGLVFEFPLTSAQTDLLRADAANNPHLLAHLRRLAPKAGVEVGYALGVSADETLDYSADGAIYVGVTLHVLP